MRNLPTYRVTIPATRITTELATELATPRNEFVAALSDEAFIAHATIGGHLEKLTRQLRKSAIPLATTSPSDALLKQS